MTTLGARIKAVRENLKLNQVEFSRRLNIDQSTLANYEMDRRSPKADMLVAIADIGGVTVDYLLGRKKSAKKELPDLTPKDEREIAKQLENMMNNLDDKTGFAAVGGTVEDENDRELLRASLEMALRLSKQIAKKKYTPKKYRKE